MFMTQKGKINKITRLNEQIENATKEIESADTINKIVHLYIKDCAIPFFMKEKLGAYNGVINMFA